MQRRHALLPRLEGAAGLPESRTANALPPPTCRDACSLGGQTEQRRAANATLEYRTLADLIRKTGRSRVDVLKVGPPVPLPG